MNMRYETPSVKKPEESAEYGDGRQCNGGARHPMEIAFLVGCASDREQGDHGTFVGPAV